MVSVEYGSWKYISHDVGNEHTKNDKIFLPYVLHYVDDPLGSHYDKVYYVPYISYDVFTVGEDKTYILASIDFSKDDVYADDPKVMNLMDLYGSYVEGYSKYLISGLYSDDSERFIKDTFVENYKVVYEEVYMNTVRVPGQGLFMNVGRRDCLFRRLPKELKELKDMLSCDMRSTGGREDLLTLYDNFGKLVSKTNYTLNKNYRYRVEEGGGDR